MSKKAFHKVFSLSMALLVLFSTVSFTIEKHFCGDTLIDSAVFSEAQKCIKEALEQEQAAFSKMDCCKDELQFIKGQDNLKLTTFDDFQVNHLFLFGNISFGYTNLFEGLPEQIIPHKDYTPPNLVADIQVLDQVFII